MSLHLLTPQRPLDTDRLRAFRERTRLDRQPTKRLPETQGERDRRVREYELAKEVGIPLGKVSLRHPMFDQPEGYHSLEALIEDERQALAQQAIQKAQQTSEASVQREQTRSQVLEHIRALTGLKERLEREERLRENKRQELMAYFNALSEQAQDELLAAAKAALAGERTADAPYQAPPLPPVGGAYKTLPSRLRISVAEVIAFTKEVWGPWLKSCHPSLPYDAMTRQDLQQRDPRLFNRLIRDVPAAELAQVIQTISQRLDDRDAALTHEEPLVGLGQAAARLASRATRARRQTRGQQPSPSASNEHAHD